MTRLKRKKELPSSHKDDVRFGTPNEVSAYRAKRLSGYETIIEIGAGAGFQTNAFAKVAKQVIAVDIDEERLRRGKFPHNVTTIVGDALREETIEELKNKAKGKIAVFLDPERPAAAEQRTLAQIKPNITEFIATYARISKDIAIELPPFLGDIPFDCEREYLSINGKLNRLTIYLGDLKKDNISAVELLSGNRIAHNNVAKPRNDPITPKFILEPDAALEHAGLAPVALNMQHKRILLGKKPVYLTETPYNGPFFKAYRIIATTDIEKHLVSCGILILHGSMSENEQKSLLKRLNAFCRGKKRLHLFVGEQRYLAERVDY